MPYISLKYAINKKKKFYNLEKEITTLILGNSQIECSVNDSIFLNSINLASSADSYFYSYLKLRKFIDSNKHVSRVILGFDIRYLWKSNERWYNGDALSHKFSIYADLFFFDDIINFIKIKPSGLIKGFLLIPFNNYRILTPFRECVNFKNQGIGSFLQSKKLLTNNHLKNLNRKVETDISSIEKYYLEKVVKICEENDIEIILLTPPIHSKIISIEENLNYKNAIVSKDFVKKYFPKTKYFDYNSFFIENSGFRDPTHLNVFGANKFSKKFLKDLNQN